MAVTGPEGLNLVPVFKPDVVLLDLWLPGAPGERRKVRGEAHQFGFTLVRVDSPTDTL
jgi:hypothetical protein